MANGLAPNVFLGDLRHSYRRLQPGLSALLLEHVLESKSVDDRGQHTHVVGLGSIESTLGTRHATPDIAATNHDGDLDIKISSNGQNVIGKALNDLAIDPIAEVSGKGFTGQLQQHPAPPGLYTVAQRDSRRCSPCEVKLSGYDQRRVCLNKCRP